MQQSAKSPMLTDLYQLTMAQAYIESGIADTEGCFHLYFRENPFSGGFAVAAGLEQVVEWIESWHFTQDNINYLRSQMGADGEPLFSDRFLKELGRLEFTCDVHAVPEGTVVFPREPLLRISGPLPVCQLAETAVLAIVNFQTLIATKAARCRLSAGDDRIVEFGLRRAQGPDGGLSASRAAFLGGADATSNVLAGEQYGIPISGTHAHSWVMAFDDERQAFEAYADALPNNVTLLVDTYDTLQGVRNAVETGIRLRERGQDLIGIRIDSGDLAWLSVRARHILDEAGFTNTKIVASNELDEHLIASLKEQGAAIDIWGVGTKLATGWDQPALGGVYKLSAVRLPGGDWTPRVKVTEQTAKVTTPGVQGVRRYRSSDGQLAGDMIYDVSAPPSGEPTMVDPADPTRRKTFGSDQTFSELLGPVFERGERVWTAPPVGESRELAMRSISELDPTITRFLNPHVYPVGVERGLNDLKTALVLKARGIAATEAAPSPDAVAHADEVVRRGVPRKKG